MGTDVIPGIRMITHVGYILRFACLSSDVLLNVATISSILNFPAFRFEGIENQGTNISSILESVPFSPYTGTLNCDGYRPLSTDHFQHALFPMF